MMQDIYLKTDGLTRVFRTPEIETIALDGINLSVKQGEFIAIMGPSGCGKSTLLNLLGLIDSPTSGRIFLEGHEVSGLKEPERVEKRKGKISFIFQNFNLIDDLNVFDNVELPLFFLNLSVKERRERVKNELGKMKISHRARHYPKQLSGGQHQRVAICRATVTDPGLILADEPTGNLDSKNGTYVMELLSDLNRKGTTILMVTHSRRDASYAHRIVRLSDGKIIRE